HDGRVAQLCKPTGLLEEAVAFCRRLRIIVEDLDGYGPVELSVVGEVHGSAAARAQWAAHLVTTERGGRRPGGVGPPRSPWQARQTRRPQRSLVGLGLWCPPKPGRIAFALRRLLLCQNARLSGGHVRHSFEDANRQACIRPILPGACRPIRERQLSAGE